jgi:hypothetical protein
MAPNATPPPKTTRGHAVLNHNDSKSQVLEAISESKGSVADIKSLERRAEAAEANAAAAKKDRDDALRVVERLEREAGEARREGGGAGLLAAQMKMRLEESERR